MMNVHSSRLPSTGIWRDAELRKCAKRSRQSTLKAVRSDEGPTNDRAERRRQRDAEKQTALQARIEERQKRAAARKKDLDGAIRKPSIPGVALTVAITTGVVALAESINLLQRKVSSVTEQGTPGIPSQSRGIEREPRQTAHTSPSPSDGPSQCHISADMEKPTLAGGIPAGNLHKEPGFRVKALDLPRPNMLPPRDHAHRAEEASRNLQVDRLKIAATKSSSQAPATGSHAAARGGGVEQRQQRVASVAVRVSSSGDVGSSGNGDREAESLDQMSRSLRESGIGSSQKTVSELMPSASSSASSSSSSFVPSAHKRQTVNAKEASPQSSPTRGNEEAPYRRSSTPETDHRTPQSHAPESSTTTAQPPRASPQQRVIPWELPGFRRGPNPREERGTTLRGTVADRQTPADRLKPVAAPSVEERVIAPPGIASQQQSTAAVVEVEMSPSDAVMESAVEETSYRALRGSADEGSPGEEGGKAVSAEEVVRMTAAQAAARRRRDTDATKPKTWGAAIGPFGVAIYGGSGSGGSATAGKDKDADLGTRNATGTGPQSRGSRSDGASLPAPIAKSLARGDGSGASGDVNGDGGDSRGSSSGGGGGGGDSSGGSGGSGGAGGTGGSSSSGGSGGMGDAGGGGQLPLVLAAALLGVAATYAAYGRQLGARIARLYRAGMAPRVFIVFVALAVGQGALANPILTAVGLASATITWVKLDFEVGTLSEKPAVPSFGGFKG